MKDSDQDEYFQYTGLDKIKEKLKQEVDKINELIMIKESNIMNGDVISKLKDDKRDVKEELEIIEKLKVPKERLDEIMSQHFAWLE